MASCHNLELMSSSSYYALRTSGFVKLVSDRTLRDYSHYFENKPGFQDDQLMNEIEKNDLKGSMLLLVDEMKIKEGLVYNKVSGEIVGFTNIEDINQELLRLEQESDHPLNRF